MAKTYYRTVTIAGSDSGGGAGIQADLKTFSALGCFGMSVITALTAQNTTGVTGIHPVPPSFAAEQMKAVFSDMGADAVKIGMLYSAELVETVADLLKSHHAERIVLDPVMLAQSGDRLLQDEAVDAIKKYLMPLADIVTPNLPEAEILVGYKIRDTADIQKAVRDIARYKSRNVLLKGGHIAGNDCEDFLYVPREDRMLAFAQNRIETRNNHGTGCTLSSAIAAFLAKGEGIEDAVRKAKAYITKAIRAGAEYTIGNGKGPVCHFFDFWN